MTAKFQIKRSGLRRFLDKYTAVSRKVIDSSRSIWELKVLESTSSAGRISKKSTPNDWFKTKSQRIIKSIILQFLNLNLTRL